MEKITKRVNYYYRHYTSVIASFFRRLLPEYVFIGKYNIKYKIDPSSSLDNEVKKKGITSDWAALGLVNIISENAVVADIGAHAGHLSLVWAKLLVPKGHIYAFEPERTVFKKLFTNIRLNKFKNITPLMYALTDTAKPGFMTLYQREAVDLEGFTNRGISSLARMSSHVRAEKSVPVTSLDSYMRAQKVKRVHLIKIDVEGMEHEVLLGARHTIDSGMPVVIYEYSTVLDKESRRNNSKKAYTFFKRRKYIQYLIVNEKKLKKITNAPTGDIQANVLALPSKFTKSHSKILSKLIQ